MWKSLAAAAAAIVLGSSLASAQAPRERPDGPRAPAFSRDNAEAFIDARIAALHAGLRLTPDQERMWPAFEQAYRDLAKLRLDRALGAAPPATDDPIARLGRRADLLTRRGAALKSLADAAAPLWQSFDDGQKRRFAVLARTSALRLGLLGRPDDRFGPPGRDGDRFGPDRRGFGPGWPRFGDDGFRPGFGRPFGRDGDEFGYGRGPRDLYPGPRGRGDDYGRDDRNYGRDDFGRSYGRDDRELRGFRRGPLPWRYRDGRFWREGRDADPDRGRSLDGTGGLDEERL
jgi:zinc resistance-associated protein